MCGRFTQADRAESIAKAFGAILPAALNPPRPSWNVAPSRDALVVASLASPDPAQAGRRIVKAAWGFLPAWSRGPLIGARPINARIETAARKPFYRDAMRHGRCLIPCEGFYEWQEVDEDDGRAVSGDDMAFGDAGPSSQLPLFGDSLGPPERKPGRPARKRAKIPWFFHPRDSSFFALAGLWAEWRSPAADASSTHASFSILTTTPNELMEPIHDRMPVVVSPDLQDIWLADRALEDEEVDAFARPADVDSMECWRVSCRVNHPDTDDARLVQPVHDRGEA